MRITKTIAIIALLTVSTMSMAQNTQNLANNLLFHEAADGASIFGTYVSKQNPMVHSITQTSRIYYNGTKSAKFELWYTDTMNNSGTRSEITFPTNTNNNRWYSFAVYFPALDWDYDSDDEVINQWHQGGGLTPALCIRTVRDSIFVRIVKDVTGLSSDTWINLGVIEKNVWRSYVLHINHSSTSSGQIEIWRDNRKILDRAGANMYTVAGSVTNPNWKLGIYKSGWNDDETTMTKRRVILFDDIRLGNENSNYREMCPNPNL
jgi:hypothetical protein